MNRLVPADQAQAGLLEHLAVTEQSLRFELRRFDKKADCQIIAAADLGIPYDALRLGGGFATGCYVEWDCSVPVVPVDITMNIDTSSVFWVSDTAIDIFTAENLGRVRNTIEDHTSYEWNFDASNHFIVFTQDMGSNEFAVIVHSNEKEFKNQYHGLCPTDGNWFDSDIHVSADGRVRLVAGRSAEVFTSMAKMLEPYNIVRHRFLIHELFHGSANILREEHTHHYFMPSESSAAMGCYVVRPGSRVPIFSQPGKPILMFEVGSGGPNTVSLEGDLRCVVPHGWGMSTDRPLDLQVHADWLDFQGNRYPRRPGVSLLADPSVQPRHFPSSDAFLEFLTPRCPGLRVSEFTQIRSLTRFGFTDHTLQNT